MKYNEYISSAIWRQKRQERLALDGNCCRLCDEDGTRYRLEVHHRPTSYQRIPNESVENDLITLCSRCHDLVTSSIREDRYGKREINPIYLEIDIRQRQEIKDYGMANSKLQVDLASPTFDAQRTDSRPAKQVRKIVKADFQQAQENRCRPGRNGTN